LSGQWAILALDDRASSEISTSRRLGMKTKSRTLDEKLKVTLRGDVGKDSSARPKRAKGATREKGKSKEAGTEVAQFYSALRLHNAEIKQWLTADPSRIAALREDPKAIIKTLINHLGITIPDLTHVVANNESAIDFEFYVTPGIETVGSGLMQKVWAHIAKSSKNTKAFQLDPEAVVRSVASANSASTEDTEAVVRAVLIASGKLPDTTTVRGFPFLDEELEGLGQLEDPRLRLRYLDEVLEEMLGEVGQPEEPKLTLRIRR
jgi:hypothetical protein